MATTGYRPISLADVVRHFGGWPIDFDAVVAVLEAADRLLPPFGRYIARDLTEEESAALFAALQS